MDRQHDQLSRVSSIPPSSRTSTTSHNPMAKYTTCSHRVSAADHDTQDQSWRHETVERRAVQVSVRHACTIEEHAHDAADGS
ncbi:hypothetical protein C5142_12735 [Rhodococcus sp. BGS-1C]|uniref:hypothetical protein n=1 Tax=unclassified Rhodococcus (in: high G+C Gram-positive bacteria) TaxID=192944 RepID=UPI0019CFFCBA|nr:MULTISPECIES: hypothetical protein [unclassified Rhodococcus (in: high G+C Gram-positive bacteria)]MCC8930608.1 hypothetical protein [Rhodococcus sp. I2R]